MTYLRRDFSEQKIYVVQSSQKLVERCVAMTTDPGDLVLDPTCGSGTTAYVAEQWGRRWITVDTSPRCNLHLPAPVSWEPDILTTCSSTAATGR